MALLIIGLIVLVIGVAVGAYFISAKNKGFGVTAISLAAVVAVGLAVASCAASVPTGHTGILTTFGKVENTTLEAGFNMKAPWQKVVNMDNRVQKANTVLSCFSSDIQEVTVSYTVNYQIDKTNAQEIYKTVGVSYYETVVVPNVAEAVKLIVARYTAEQLISSRAELANGIELALRDSLANYNIQVVSAAIEDMDFTDAFTNAVEAKQVAAQNKLQAEIEQQQKIMEQEAAAKMNEIKAKADAEAAKIKAASDAEVAKTKAQAEYEVKKIEADAVEYAGQKEAAANKAIAESITDEFLRYFYTERWDGKLPDTYVGSEDVSTIINGVPKTEAANG